jgi:hypothetical protein
VSIPTLCAFTLKFFLLFVSRRNLFASSVFLLSRSLWLRRRLLLLQTQCWLGAETRRAYVPSKPVTSFRSAFWTGASDLVPVTRAQLGVSQMKPFPKLSWFLVLLCVAVPPLSLAQRPGAKAAAAKAAPSAYNISKDVSLQGTVLSYTENSPTPPIGPHVLLQTASGNVDVHLGDVKVLRAAKLTFAQGTNVRFVGQSRKVGQNTVFLARLVQIGSQLVAVRSEHGMPVAPANLRTNKALRAHAQANQQAGAR